MVGQSISNIFPAMVPVSVVIFNPFNSISYSSADSGSMEVLSISITFFDPFISRFLLPEDLLIPQHDIQLGFEVQKLDVGMLIRYRVGDISYFGFDVLDIILEVSEGFLIPPD